MKNKITISFALILICSLFIGQTDKQNDFDAQTKYNVLERHLIKLINDKKSTDAKLVEIESELKKISARIKVHIGTKNLESSEGSKNKKTNLVQLDYGSKRLLEELQDDVDLLKTQIFGMNEFLGFGIPNDTLDDLKNSINGKANRLHFH